MEIVYVIGWVVIVIVLLRNKLLCNKYYSKNEMAGVLVGVLFLTMTAIPYTENEPVEEVNIIKTVAHIDLSNRTDLELIGTDKENDVAIYKYVKPDYNVQQGDTVYLVGGGTATVHTYDAVGFTLSSDNIVAGMSGTAVYTEDNVQIGIISSRMADGNYRCVWS